MRRLLFAFAVLSACRSSEVAGPPADAGLADAALADAEPEDGAFVADAEPVGDAEVADAGLGPYVLQVFDRARINSHAELENFQQANAALDLAGGPFASVTMTLVLETTCFPFDGWQSNPPPEGESWPADCDAFDRNLEVILDPADTATGAPGLELLRAITPFGGPLTLGVDVTDVANGLGGRHRVRVVIPTWSDGAGRVSGSNGGWNVSLRFDVTPGPAPRRVLAVIPLVDLSETDSATVSAGFEVPEGTTSARLEYRATGHGGGDPGPGCIGPAEEFCRRRHRVMIDGAAIGTLDAWRTNCRDLCTIEHYGPTSGGFDYCRENPCGAVASVRAPRANWCPGSMTPPKVFEGDVLLAAGRHVYAHHIPTILPGGVWRVSAAYFAFGD